MSHSHSNHRAQKKAKFAEPARRQSKVPALVAALAVVAVFFAYIFLRGQNAGATFAGGDAQVIAAGSEIRIPLADVSSGEAKFFQYAAANGQRARFFVMKSSDGVYRAALDACDVCYRGKRGYFQDGDDMVCKKCGQRFPSALINVVRGGCNPVPIERTVAGDTLIIHARDLESGTAYF